MTLGMTLPRGSQRSSLATFESQVTGGLQAARKKAQEQGIKEEVVFSKEGVRLLNQRIDYPRNLHLEKEGRVRVQESGFISPQSLYFNRGKQRLRLVIVFGGGNAYFKEE
ncbi:hypothetical protein [Fructobacillus papyrifericola]|uniref:Uncharacterized protein n=1 Tax=Fructobacillus papyrifericola TaxID=2713172 RepID=A0ABS5QR24_9LACO|nr:hypothetical protein [Fructobacillus papyrifericola]MBS9335650.1 hypothetical protein [Fructobacillus papyrifericola]